MGTKPPRGKSPWWGFLAILIASRASAYPYQGLRPADQVIGGPTDGYLSALHYNPAGLSLFQSSQLMIAAGARGYIGGYTRSAALPAGFAPDQSAAQSSPESRIGWVQSDMLIAGSWDLRSGAVTIGLGFYTPHNDETKYADGDPQSAAAQQLSTRYHAISSRTYSLWGTIAASLHVRPWLSIGAGFQFTWTHSRMSFFRDLDPQANDGLSCGGASCEKWSQRTLIDVDVAGPGYGFTFGILAEPIDDRLWVGLSYISPMFTSGGTEVGLDGQPRRLPWDASDHFGPCGRDGTGARVSQGDDPAKCGAAHTALGFPHTIYVGIRGRKKTGIPSLSQTGELTSEVSEASPRLRRSKLRMIDLTGWLRLTVPTREDLVLSLEQRIFAPSELTIPLEQRPAVALAFGIRQIFPRFFLAQELLYESPRTSAAAVSPANLEGHKLDLSLATRLRLQRRLWLLLTVGVTGVFFSKDAGSGFSSALAATCRTSGYDVTTSACQNVQDGWAVPPAAGAYWLVQPHGSTGLELNL